MQRRHHDTRTDRRKLRLGQQIRGPASHSVGLPLESGHRAVLQTLLLPSPAGQVSGRGAGGRWGRSGPTPCLAGGVGPAP